MKDLSYRRYVGYIRALVGLSELTEWGQLAEVLMEDQTEHILDRSKSLAAGEFLSGAGQTAAVDANDHVIYNTTTGDLYYDADGVGGAAATLFAHLTTPVALTSASFVIEPPPAP